MQLLPVNDNNNRPSEGDNYPLTPADSFDSLDDIEGKGLIREPQIVRSPSVRNWSESSGPGLIGFSHIPVPTRVT